MTLLQRVMEQRDLTVHAWQRRYDALQDNPPAETGSTLKDIVKGKSRSPRLETLDQLAIAAGYEDFVQMAAGATRRVDTRALAAALAEILEFNEAEHKRWSLQQIALRVTAAYNVCSRPKEDRRPGDVRDAIEAINSMESVFARENRETEPTPG